MVLQKWGGIQSRDSKQAETFMKLVLSNGRRYSSYTDKVSYRLHNMRTIQHLKRQKQIQIASETLNLYTPLAHRFGLFSIKNELEDLCFKAIDPTSFKFVARKLREKKESRELFIKDFMMPIGHQYIKQNFTFEIKGRLINIHSIYRKMKQDGKPFEEVYDLLRYVSSWKT